MVSEHFFLFASLGFLFTHELDAIRCKEWRIFPATSFLPDDVGYVVFTLLHVPLFAVACYAISNLNAHTNVVRAWDIFSIVHIGLHILFLRHPENRFTTFVSWFLIVGAGACGLLDMMLSLQ
jgi:hypothetical protein